LNVFYHKKNVGTMQPKVSIFMKPCIVCFVSCFSVARSK